MKDDILEIGSHRFRSRLIVGSGKYKDFPTTKAATEAAEAEMITVAVRRVNITDPGKENLLDYIDPKRYVPLADAAARMYLRGAGAADLRPDRLLRRQPRCLAAAATAYRTLA